MLEALHTWALAPAAIGTCCLAVDRVRARVPEMVMSITMMLAMLDTVLGIRIVPPIGWAGLLLVSAMILPVVLRPRRIATRPSNVQDDHKSLPPTGADQAASDGLHRKVMSTHTALGSVAMAVLILLMMPAGAIESAPAVHHGTGSGSLLVLALGVVGFGVASLLLAFRPARVLDRIQYGCMGLSTLAMTVPYLAAQ